MILTIEEKAQKRIRRKRMLSDKNFRVWWVIILLLLAIVIFGIIYNFVVPWPDRGSDPLAADSRSWFFISTVMIPIIIELFPVIFIYMMSSTFISDMFDEELEVTDDGFVQSCTESRGGGAMEGVKGNVRNYSLIRWCNIKKCRYDPRTERIEVYGMVQRLRKSPAQILDKSIDDSRIVLYDYYDPKLIGLIKSRGISITEEEIKYKLVGCRAIWKAENHKED